MAVPPEWTACAEDPVSAAVVAASAAVVADSVVVLAAVAVVAAADDVREWRMKMKKVTGIQITNRQLATLFGIVVLAASLTIPVIGQKAAQTTTPQTFKTPAEAANAMFVAAKAGDTDELMRIFGPQSKGLLSSGDPVADKNEREQILKKYEQMHRIV